MSDDEPCLLRQDEAGIATLTLNRPKARNSLSHDLLQALADQITRLADDRLTKVVVIKGAGPAFCAGHDLKEMRAAGFDCAFTGALFGLCSAVMQGLVALPQPVIAQVHGIATAAGCQLVASCDLAVAASDARFATPGVNIGLFCSTPMVALTRNVGRKAAMQMLLTGDAIDGETALGFGLINELAAPEALAARTMALARQLAGKSSTVLALGKRTFHQQVDLPLRAAYELATKAMTDNLQWADAQEGIGAFIDKRDPVWRD